MDIEHQKLKTLKIILYKFLIILFGIHLEVIAF